MTISGIAAQPFGAVEDVFHSNFEEGAEIGACFAVFIDGECVVDLYGGHADREEKTPWTEETITGVYSSGKAVMALLAARAVGEARLRYDAPIAEIWPEFAGGGKRTITLAEAMSHQAGLCGFPDEMPPATWLDWEGVCRRIEAMAPLYPPRSASGYSPQLIGFVVGEALRRVSGKSVGELVRELAEARGLEIHCGLRASEMARTTYVRKPPQAPDLGEINEYTEVAFLKPWSAPGRVSREDWMAAEIPAANMHANARGLAGVVHPLANRGAWGDGETIIEPSVIEEALGERIRGDDLVLPFELSWSAGLMRNINRHFGPNQQAYGHGGFGGSCVVVDPSNRLSAAYVMNRQSPHLVGDPRAVKLLDAVYAVL